MGPEGCNCEAKDADARRNWEGARTWEMPHLQRGQLGHLGRCDNASEGQRRTSQGHTPRAQAGTEHGPLCGHGDKAWIREEVRVCRVMRRPRRWAHVRALGRPPPDIPFPSTTCRWPALPTGLGMWRVLMFLPQELCPCTCMHAQTHTCTNLMKSKVRMGAQWSSPTSDTDLVTRRL